MNAKQLFQKYHKRMVAEGILKATLIGLMAALTVLFVTAAVCWFVGFKGIWLSVVLFVVVLAATAVTVYLVKYRPTTRSIARRVDELGLEERLITMTELEGDDSYIATRQRQDAMESLNKVSADLIKIAVSVALIAGVAIAGVCAAGTTTVYALYNAGVIKSGVELVNPEHVEESKSFKVEYVAGKNGSLVGETKQTVYEGEDALAVMAVADKGYIFVGWSDGVTDAYRVDYAVSGKIKVTANFVQATDADPDKDEDNNPYPDDLPLPGDKSDKPNNTPQPSDKPSTEGNGSYNANNQYIDGEHNYQDGLGDAKGNAQDWVNNNGNLTPGEGDIIGDYYDGISN